MTLADLVNAPNEIEFEGNTYRLSPPNLLAQGEFQRWLEDKTFDAIQRRRYEDPAAKAEDRTRFHRDVGAGIYEWGGEVAAKASMQPAGLAKLLSIIGRDDGLTEPIARNLIKARLHEATAAIMSKVVNDPKDLAAVLAMLGLPSDHLSSPSVTYPSEPPKTPKPSSDSTMTSSSESMPNSSAVPADIPA